MVDFWVSYDDEDRVVIEPRSPKARSTIAKALRLRPGEGADWICLLVGRGFDVRSDRSHDERRHNVNDGERPCPS